MKRSVKIVILALVVAAVCLCGALLGACVVSEPSLAASFDDSHLVHVGDELDSLKPYITVTYTDSMGRERQVNGFSLRGTLQEGSCELTVVYAGIEATVTVNVLPSAVAAEKGTKDNPYTLAEAYFAAPELGENGYSEQPVYVRAHVEMAEHSGDEWALMLKEQGEQYNIIVYATLAEGVTSVERYDLVLVCGYLHFIDGSYGDPPQLGSREEPCTVLERYAAGTLQNPYSVSLALSLAQALEDDCYSASPVYVQGRIDGDVTQGSPGYRFDITDGTRLLTVYYALLGEGVEALGSGDLVTVYGYLYNYRADYQSVYEIKSNNGVDATVVECVHPVVSEITLSVDKTVLEGEDVATFTVTTVPAGHENEVDLIVDGMGRLAGEIVGNKFVPDADFDTDVSVYAELDGIVSDYVHFYVWGGGKTLSRPLSVGQAAQRADLIEEYSECSYYVRGVLASELTTAISGYTFLLRDADSDATLPVVNAMFDSSVRIGDVKAGDTLTVLGKVYGKNAAWRMPGGNCTVAQWAPQSGVALTLSADKTQLKVGESTPLHVETYNAVGSDITLEVTYGYSVAHIENDMLVADSAGQCGVRAQLELNGAVYRSNELIFTVTDAAEQVSILLKADRYLIEYSDNTFVYAEVQPADYASQLSFEITDGQDVASLVGNASTQRSVLPMDAGYVTIVARVGSFTSNAVTIQIVRYDPYTNVGASGFYDRYTPAADLEDSYWRTKHSLMSGSIAEQDQEPTLAANRPKQGSNFVRNTDENYFDNGNSYKVVDYRGNVVNTIYKYGAYVTLEEVAAYVYAWGDVPANYIASNSGSPKNSTWGRFLRLNHNEFSGNTSAYPYEPVLPNISGCGGSYKYYEIDIGTTGTDCDPSYASRLYNDGSTITRGAARIVYARYEGSRWLAPTERYVFYTYNHYNDFQEYLNYQGGWGEMFGNITGGGRISDKYNCNPTPYVPTARKSFS